MSSVMAHCGLWCVIKIFSFYWVVSCGLYRIVCSQCHMKCCYLRGTCCKRRCQLCPCQSSCQPDIHRAYSWSCNQHTSLHWWCHRHSNLECTALASTRRCTACTWLNPLKWNHCKDWPGTSQRSMSGMPHILWHQLSSSHCMSRGDTVQQGRSICMPCSSSRLDFRLQCIGLTARSHLDNAICSLDMLRRLLCPCHHMHQCGIGPWYIVKSTVLHVCVSLCAQNVCIRVYMYLYI